MAYNFKKKTCDDCGCKKPTKKELQYLSYHQRMDRSFRLSLDGSVRCADCERENNLKKLFKTMDEKEKSAKEEMA